MHTSAPCGQDAAELSDDGQLNGPAFQPTPRKKSKDLAKFLGVEQGSGPIQNPQHPNHQVPTRQKRNSALLDLQVGSLTMFLLYL